MKKISVLFILICFINISFVIAQTNKGRVLIGVSSAINISGAGPGILSMGYTTSKHKSDINGFNEPDPDKSMSINVLPRFGFFIFNNFVLGADLCLGYNNHKNGVTNSESKQTILGAGPFLRFYIPSNKVHPFIEGNAAFSSEHHKYTSSDGSFDSDTKSSVTSFGGGVGLAAPIGEKATFDIMVSYNSLTSKEKDNNPNNDRYVNGAFGIKFGFTIYLGSEL